MENNEHDVNSLRKTLRLNLNIHDNRKCEYRNQWLQNLFQVVVLHSAASQVQEMTPTCKVYAVG